MKIKISFVALSFLILAGLWANALPGEEGKAIFIARCSGCHNINRVVTGPALAGVDQRRSIDWIINFVHSSQKVVRSGDPYAVALFEKFNKIQMPDHPDLSAENIKNIVEYVKAEAAVKMTDPTLTKPSVRRPAYKPLSLTKDYWALISYLFAVLVLIGTLLFAVHVKELQMKSKRYGR